VTAQAPSLESTRGLPQPLGFVAAGLAGLGLLAFAGGLATDWDTAWRAFHVNFLFFAGLAQGGLVLACAFTIIGATWPGPVRRVAEGLGGWVPFSAVLFALTFLGREAIYEPWIGHPPAGKEAWLNLPRLYAVDLGILIALAWLTWSFLAASARGRAGDAAAARRARVLAPITAIVYVLGYTVVAFDQVMSLSPTWYSNLFGWYFAWGGFLSGVAATTLISVLWRTRSEPMRAEIDEPRMHDLGKMVFAFSIFWMYLFFSQYIVIWYGNLPEETQFFYSRFGEEMLQGDAGYPRFRTFAEVVQDLVSASWSKLGLATWLCCWIVPFWVLLGQRPKRTPAILGSVAAIVVLGFWLERNMLIWPSYAPGDEGAWLGLIQIGTALGFLGAFVLVYLLNQRRMEKVANRT
jgi:hypothetical protein